MVEYKTLEEREEYLTAYLTGVIFGDGCISKHSNTYRIDIYNSNKDYLSLLLSIITEVMPFNHIYINSRKTTVNTKYNYCLSINNKNFHKIICPFKSNYRYSIPNWITTKNEKAGFISGLFDTDGCVWKKTIPINLTTKYKTSLEPIKEVLKKDFEIESYIHSYKGLSRLNIKSYKNIVKFEKEIGFLHPLKNELLRNLLEKFYIKEKTKLGKEQEVKTLHRKGLGITQISNVIGIPKTTVIFWLDEYFPNRIRLKQHSTQDYFKAFELFKYKNILEISKILNIPKPTIVHWIKHNQMPHTVRKEIKNAN